MAINVWGTQGTVNEVQWAKLAEGFGQKYTLVSGNAVTSSGRNLSIPPRVSIGCGVAVEVTTAETRAVPVPAAGQWFLLVLRRQWGANRGATFELINGPTTTDAAQTTPPTTLPAARNKQPGLIDDEPVAWVHARASTTTLAIWQMQTKRDGRVPGIWAMFDANEQGMFDVFSEADGATFVWLSGAWQPTEGNSFRIVRNASALPLGAGVYTDLAPGFVTDRSTAGIAWSGGRFLVSAAGRYRLSGNIFITTQVGYLFTPNSAPAVDFPNSVYAFITASSAASEMGMTFDVEMELASGAAIYLTGVPSGGAAGTLRPPTPGDRMRSWIDLRRIK